MRTLQQSWIESGLLNDTHPLRDTTVIMAQNAWEYADSQGWLDDNEFSLKANVAPVLNDFMVQFMYSAKGVGSIPIGLHFKSARMLDKSDNHIGWMYKVGMYLSPKNHARASTNRAQVSEPFMLMDFTIDIHGYIDTPISSILSPHFKQYQTLQGNDSEKVRQLYQYFIIPGLFAINLMHCKNVHLVEAEPTKRQKRMSKKHNKPLYRYHILKVATGKGAYSGLTATTNINMSHHICRGHFRTYEDYAPLFGKYVGTFWIPSHVRGRESEGIVEKDYDIETGG